MKKMLQLAISVTAFAGLAVSSSAFAATANCGVSDVTWEGVSSAECQGVVLKVQGQGVKGEPNNDSETAVNDQSFFSYHDWFELTKSDSLTPSVFYTTSEPNTWYTTEDLSMYEDVMLVLKQSTVWAGYLAPENLIKNADGTYSGTWSTSTLASTVGVDAGISHMTLYARGEKTVVPLPAAAYLFGSALLGMAGIGYRRNKKQA